MFCLTLTDITLSNVIFAPIIITYWLITWEFLHKFPKVFPPWWTLYFSILISIITGLLREPCFQFYKTSASFYKILLTKLYIYIVVTSGIAAWKSGWSIMEMYFNTEIVVWTLTIGAIILCTIGGVCNLLATPFVISFDNDLEQIYMYPTPFDVESSEKLWLYLWDCIFSVCIIGPIIVFVWRGSWTLLDLLLYPGNPLLSAWASTAIGYGLVMVTFALQPIMKYLAKTLTGLYRLVVVDVYLLLAFSGTINVWRGIWNLINHYFLTDTAIINFVITHIISFTLLTLFNASNSILVRGIYLDGEEKGERCVDFPCYYFRLLLQVRRQNKLLKQCEKEKGMKNENDADDMLLPKNNITEIIIIPQIENNNQSKENNIAG